MSTGTNLALGLNKIITRAGIPIAVKYFTETVGSVWDDDVALTFDSATWTSGVILPLDTREGSTDSVLVQQGKLIEQDMRLYVNGSLAFTGSDTQMKVQTGSPSGEAYSLIPEGGITYQATGVNVYKKVYLRRLTNGSLIGE